MLTKYPTLGHHLRALFGQGGGKVLAKEAALGLLANKGPRSRDFGQIVQSSRVFGKSVQSGRVFGRKLGLGLVGQRGRSSSRRRPICLLLAKIHTPGLVSKETAVSAKGALGLIGKKQRVHPAR